ncbi:hypothetical protein EBT25_00790 [bacterium]|nr:hypothetical protein [bacterium]
MEENFLSAVNDIILPVMESATVLAAHYCKACGRNTVTDKDVEYGLKFAIRNVTGKQLGTLYPEIYEDSDSGSDIEVVDDSDEPFTRYEGSEDLYVKMNECFDTWAEWEPQTPAERLLKNSANKVDG